MLQYPLGLANTFMRCSFIMEKKPWYILTQCCLLLMSVAVLYVWSVYVTHLEQVYGWTRLETSGVFTLSICAYCAGSLLSGFLSVRIEIRYLLWIAGGLLFAGFLISAVQTTVFAVACGYGGLCGCGVGMAYNAILSVAARWFPDKPGMCNGVLLTCYGFATFPMAAITNHLLAALGWKQTLLIFAVFECAVLFLGGLQFKRFPNQDRSNSITEKCKQDCSPFQMFRAGHFYAVFFWLMTLTASGLAAIGSAAQMALDLGAKSGTAALLAGVISAAGCIGRLGFGKIFDMLGNRKSALCDSLIMVAAITIMTFSFLFHSLIVLFIGLMLLGISYGGMSSLCASLVRGLFGTKYYPRNLSIMSLQMIPASLLGPLLGSSIYAYWENYKMVCIILLLLDLIGTALIVFNLKTRNDCLDI